jgi:pilus assembly protein CpaB
VKPKTMILMIVAVGCGLAASYMTSKVIADRGDKPDEEKVTVLVAKQNLVMGTLIKEPEKFFDEKQFTKGEEPKKAIRSLDEIKGKYLNKPLGAEQFVTADDLTDKDSIGISAMMPKGFRAYGIKVTPENCVGGFVLPHSRIDIVLAAIRGDAKEQYSKIILQNVLVLAVDQVNVRPEDKQAVIANTVTVAVTPQEAEKLAIANSLGDLRLILRPFGDDEKIATSGATPRGVTRGGDQRPDDFVAAGENEVVRSGKPWLSKVPDVQVPTVKVVDVKPAPSAAPPPPPPKTHTLTIFNGESVTKAVFTLGDKESNSSTRIEKSEPEGTTTPKTKPTSQTPPPVAVKTAKS